MNQTEYLASKPRYEILDGLRGVAALIVVAFHLLETYSGDVLHQIINHGYLAVDFFFVLSGFVIGYAYDDRWTKMTTWDFFKRRLVRLQPMVIMGTLIGASLFFLQQSPAFPNIEHTSWLVAAVMVVLGCLMIPVGVRWDIRGWTEMNALNGPNWSLTWEYLANILYALVIRRFSRLALMTFVAFAAFLTIDLTMNIDTFGIFAEHRAAQAYTVIGGWSLTAPQIYIGITRLLYPFFVGLLLSRIGKKITLRGGFWWCSLAIAVVMAVPRLGGTERMWLNGAYEALCILLVMPLIVLAGAGSRVTDGRSVKVCKFLGDISYPLYITHFPFVYLQIAYASNHPDAPLGTVIFLSAGVFLLSVAAAYASLRLYDEPVREWLKRRFLVKRAK